jgi:plastocyanin
MIMRPPRALAALVLVLALVGVACGGGDDGGGDEPAVAGEVEVTDNKFVPETIEVAIGDTVTWVFKGAVKHNVKGSGLDSGNMKDGTYEHTFNTAGTFKYQCTIHPGMNGKVEVS